MLNIEFVITCDQCQAVHRRFIDNPVMIDLNDQYNEFKDEHTFCEVCYKPTTNPNKENANAND